tara:strand:- start:613 stop:1314 length:702 start_codon:yes stop_codon:yes gene_type:complete
MIEEKEFEIYLYIEKNKYIIFLFDPNKLTNVYKNEITFYENIDIDFNELTNFLDNNIFKIEKLLGNFIKNVHIIAEDNLELETDICIKKKNTDNKTNKKNLNQALLELKDLFKENNQDQDIVHMLIKNFIINGENHNFFIENLNSDYLHLDVKFITLSERFISKLNNTLEKYQIKIKQIISGKYLKKLMKEKNIELSLMAHKIREGHNPNEIEIVPKTKLNKGFFEKFFQLFS